MFKKILPESLLGRSITIIFVPIFLLVIITSVIFYQTSWNIISKRLTESVVADINVIVKLIKEELETEAIEIAEQDFKMKIHIQKNSKVDNIIFIDQRGILSKRLNQALINNRSGVLKTDLYNLIWPSDIDIHINKLDTHLTNLKNFLKKELNYDLKFISNHGTIQFLLD